MDKWIYNDGQLNGCNHVHTADGQSMGYNGYYGYMIAIEWLYTGYMMG